MICMVEIGRGFFWLISERGCRLIAVNHVDKTEIHGRKGCQGSSIEVLKQVSLK